MELDLNLLGNEDFDPKNPFDERVKQTEVTEETEEQKIVLTEDSPFKTDEELEDDPEGVGKGSQEERTTSTDEGTSPNNYTSIAQAFLKDGVLTLDETEVSNVKTAEDFVSLMEKELETRLDDRIKRVEEALNVGVAPDVVSEYENTLSYLNSIQETDIKAETKEAEQLRFNLIYQDRINRGFSEEKAKKEVDRIFASGTDMEEALDAKEDNIKYFTTSYTAIKAQKEEETKAERTKVLEVTNKVNDMLINTEEPIKGVKLTKTDRQKLAAQYTSVAGKDASNRPVNAVQKYINDNPVDWQYKVNLLFYLTNGFKDISKVIDKKVKENTGKQVSHLKNVIERNNPSFDSGWTPNIKDDNANDIKGISFA